MYGVHMVTLDEARRPVSYTVGPKTPPGKPTTLGRLGGFGFTVAVLETQRITLRRTGTGHQFLLEIAPVVNTAPPCGSVGVVTRLVELDRDDRLVGSQVLYDGAAIYWSGCEKPD